MVSLTDAERFRCLCRSSPWRWQSLRFEYRALRADSEGQDASAASGLRAWARRPNALRVESLEGLLLYSTTDINDSKDDFYVSATRRSWLLPPQLVHPVYTSEGLVRRRPEAAYGEPVFGNGRWSAMLDPVELAGPAPVSFETPYANVAELLAVSEAEHEGRRVLEAVLSPNQGYRPYDAGHPLLAPGRTLVRLDWETAVCVYSHAMDGPAAGAGHSLAIHGVDEYMLDDLFVEVSMNLTDVRAHIPWPLQPGLP
ncbi:hypothetical protein [Arthrobacter sp. Marseille-P9274]|uniref:hypothetical protein n=1 Tax=Arthrobacter sp. Marseille-P9274 TaxID=2866572 RepID=UPI0021C9C8B8|nr:hypothetical protein [Arthrobacter sp. Marseille-P9274]